MEKLSYYETQNEVLGSFYLNLINYGHANECSYDSVISHLLNDYETGFSTKQKIIINTIIYGLCGNFVFSNLSVKLKNELDSSIRSNEFYILMKLLPYQEREEFLEDLLGLNLISEELKITCSNISTIKFPIDT